jgi:hypothetical protein
MLRSSSKGCISNDAVSEDSEHSLAVSSNECGGHEVCIDIVSKAVHCYACDDYVLSDAAWLVSLREHLNVIELRRDEIGNNQSAIPKHEVKDVDEDMYEMVDASDDTVNIVLIDAKAKDGDKVPSAKSDEESKYQPGITGLTNLGKLLPPRMLIFNV